MSLIAEVWKYLRARRKCWLLPFLVLIWLFGSLGVIFFVVFTPGAMLVRILGKERPRRRRTAAESYWKRRLTPGPAPETVQNQF